MNPQIQSFTPKFKPGEKVYSYRVDWDGKCSARYAKCFLLDREKIAYVLLTVSGIHYLFSSGAIYPSDLYPEEKIFRTEIEARKAFYVEKIRLLEKELQNLAEYIEEAKHEMETLNENN